VVSGGVKGADEIEAKPAILDIPTGRGRVVAFDFDPIHRYQTLGTFRLVWNALLNWNDLPPTPPPAQKGADDPDYRYRSTSIIVMSSRGRAEPQKASTSSRTASMSSGLGTCGRERRKLSSRGSPYSWSPGSKASVMPSV
jgi:hypothetical protein